MREGEAAVYAAPAADGADRAWLAQLWRDGWGGDPMYSGGRVHHLARLEAFIAWEAGRRVGAATYAPPEDGVAELVSLDALVPGRGVGSLLLQAVSDAVRARGGRALKVVTTNDNLDALGFYQRRGFRLMALRPGAVDVARRHKPTIPLVGRHGIPVRDELVLIAELAGEEPSSFPDSGGDDGAAPGS
ncbi:MAG: GNAT family N-acetyltransferase [Firmicutes bacterium]|nr:GNAT family N-acetyltransferase [Bacillota bacterium]